MRIAYLNTQYPSLSHTFIEREITAVRREGIEVRTYSIRCPDAHGTIGAEHATAAKETSYVVTGKGATFAKALACAARSPVGACRALWCSQQLSQPGFGPRLRHTAYAFEALILARMLRRDGIRHVHVHMANNGAAVALLACEADRRLTYSLTIHGSAEFFDLERLKVGAKATSAVFVRCISNFCRAQVMVATPWQLWKRLLVVHCGVDPSRFQPRDPAPAAAAPATAATPAIRLLAVGRLHSIKAYSLLIEAVAILRDADVDVHLNLVGDGPQRAELEEFALGLCVDHCITFAGAVSQDHIAARFHAADAFVVSSLMEGVPVVLMEAMACGKPVIATRVGGIPELVEHGISGLLVDPASPDALADAIRILAANPDLRARMGQAGRARVERDYDINQSGKQMAAIFRERIEPLLASSAQPGPSDVRRLTAEGRRTCGGAATKVRVSVPWGGFYPGLRRRASSDPASITRHASFTPPFFERRSRTNDHHDNPPLRHHLSLP